MILTTIALVVFTLFLVAATANAVIISLLVSLAVAGGFLSLFFLSLTATYIGALSVAAFVISAATVSAVVSVLSASGLYKCTVLWFCFWNLENQIFQVASFCLCIDRMQWHFVFIRLGWLFLSCVVRSKRKRTLGEASDGISLFRLQFQSSSRQRSREVVNIESSSENLSL